MNKKKKYQGSASKVWMWMSTNTWGYHDWPRGKYYRSHHENVKPLIKSINRRMLSLINSNYAASTQAGYGMFTPISRRQRQVLITPGRYKYPSWSATQFPTPPNSVIEYKMWHQTLMRQPPLMGLIRSDTW